MLVVDQTTDEEICLSIRPNRLPVPVPYKTEKLVSQEVKSLLKNQVMKDSVTLFFHHESKTGLLYCYGIS